MAWHSMASHTWLSEIITQATHLSNAEDLFKFLYKKGIGGKHAHFWVGWALYAENAGNYPMAEK